jgi:competence protein ComEC
MRDVGFQFSVLATAGLLITASPLEQAIAARLPEGRGGQPGWLQRLLAPAVSVPLAATLWTLPLQLLHFGVVPLYAVPANLVAGPLLTPLTLAAMLLAAVALLLPSLLPLLLLPVDPLAMLLPAIAAWFARLPMAQWQVGRPLPLLVVVFAVALLGLLLPLQRRWLKAVALLLLLAVAAAHLQLLRADQLLLVHQGVAGEGRDLLLARREGRGALISSRADPYSCRQVGSLARGLGLPRLDWVLLLDPVASQDPACWRQQSDLVVAYGDASLPLAAGERLESPGLAVQALTQDSHALQLELGRQRWLLLPDRQALQAWRQLVETPPRGVWLGFMPRPEERRALETGGRSAGWRWISGAMRQGSLPSPWRASGDSGSLQTSGA